MKLFKKLRLNSKGFGHLETLLGVFIIAAITAVGVRVLTASHAASPSSVVDTLPSTTPANIIISSSNSSGINSLKISDGSQPATLLYNSNSQNSMNSPIWVSNASAIDYLLGGGLIYTITSSGKNPTSLAGSDLVYSAASYSEVAGKLAYEQCYGVNSCGLYTSTANNTGSKLVFSPPKGDTWGQELAWTPNGKAVYFQYFNGVSQLDYYGVATSSGNTVITFNSDCNATQNPWIDNTKLACYTSQTSPGLSIFSYLSKVATPIPNLAVSSTNTIYSYSVSPNGSQIAYTTRNGYTDTSTCKVNVINVNGTNNKLLYTGHGQTCNDVDWSPSSNMIVFGANNIDSQNGWSGGSVYTMNASGTAAPYNVYNFTGSLYGLDWSTQ